METDFSIVKGDNDTMKVTSIRSARLRTGAIRLGLLAGIAGLLTGLQVQPVQASPRVAIKTDGADNSLTEFNSFRTWLGNGICAGRNTFTSSSVWTDISSPYFLSTTQAWINQNPGNFENMSVALLPSSDSENFSVITSGAHDADWQTLGTNIHNLGIGGSVIIRLGWEFNGNWYPWSANANGGTPAAYAAAFHRAATQIRSKEPLVKFCWCANLGGGWDWTTAYPGDDVVDYIAVDCYDFYNPNGWSDLLNSTPGLTQVRTFAQAHGKPEAYPEWGLDMSTNGHGDDTSFIQNMYNWFTASGSNVNYQAFWDCYCDTKGEIQGGSVNCPNSATLYHSLFGAVPTVPPAPASLSAAAGNTQVSLSWASSSGATSYSVYRGTSAGGESTTAIATGVGTTSYTNTGLTNGTTYYYKVKAVNTAGASGYSPEASATPSSGSQPVPNGTYTLTPACATGARLEVAGGGTANGTNVDISAFTGATNQQWVLTSTSGNIYKVQPVYATGMSLDCNGQTTTSGTNVQIWADAGQQNQRWALNAVTGGYTLTPQHALAQRLDVSGAATTNGSNVDIYASNGTSAQTWAVNAVSSGNTHGGTWASKAVLAASPGYTHLYQTVSVSANTNYTASIWVKGTGTLQLDAVNSAWTANLAQVNFTGTGSWQQISTGTFNSGTNTSITFQVYDNVGGAAGTLYLDDCSLGLATGGNLLANAGFESGDVTWTHTGVFTVVHNP